MTLPEPPQGADPTAIEWLATNNNHFVLLYSTGHLRTFALSATSVSQLREAHCEHHTDSYPDVIDMCIDRARNTIAVICHDSYDSADPFSVFLYDFSLNRLHKQSLSTGVGLLSRRALSMHDGALSFFTRTGRCSIDPFTDTHYPDSPQRWPESIEPERIDGRGRPEHPVLMFVSRAASHIMAISQQDGYVNIYRRPIQDGVSHWSNFVVFSFTTALFRTAWAEGRELFALSPTSFLFLTRQQLTHDTILYQVGV